MGMSETTTRAAWNRDQEKFFAKQVRDRIGDAWDWLVPEVREALVAEHVLMVVLGLVRQDIHVEDVRVLLVGVRRELGMEG